MLVIREIALYVILWIIYHNKALKENLFIFSVISVYFIVDLQQRKIQ